MKHLLHKFYILFYTKHYTIVLLSIFYLIFLKTSTITYCAYFDNGLYWTFPLEQDVAAQSWQESPYSSEDSLKERQRVLEEYKTRTEKQQKISYEDKRSRQLLESKKSTANVIVTVSTQEAENIAFLKNIEKLPLEEKAMAIDNRLFEKIVNVIANTPQDQLNTFTIKRTLCKILQEDCTRHLWLCKTEEEIHSEQSLINQMVRINYSYSVSSNTGLNNAEKQLLMHINTQLQLLNAAHVCGDNNPTQFLQNNDFYNHIYNMNCNYEKH